MTPQELRESILWNAIQGKLTTRHHDESIDEVFGDIEVSDVDEKYFDIPDTWCWCRIGDIFNLVNGKAFKPSDWTSDGVPIVRIQNLNDMSAPFNYCAGEIEEKYILYGGELLFSWSGTPGTSFGAFIWNGGKAALNQHIFIVYPRINADLMYLKYAINGELKIFIDKAHGGAGLKHITKKEFENCSLPIPPLAEQKRIVAKIEELLSYLSRYEKAWNRLEDFNRRFPADMQKSILQLAIQGKLVEQRPEEGTGEELYRQIQAEKQALIKAGKIKKEKPLPEIAEDEIPFDIPESWKWVRLRGLCQTDISYGIIKLGAEDPKGVRVLRCSDVKENYIVPDFVRTVEETLSQQFSRTILQGGEIVINVRGTLGGCAVVPHEMCGYNVAREVAVIRQCDSVNAQYIVFLLLSGYFQEYMFHELRGIAYKGLNMGTLALLPVPLPPLAEQKRIVARLEEILPLCERLK